MRLSANRFRELMYRLERVHQAIGIVGGLTFFIGSIFFLHEDPVRRVGTWLFIVGSAGMFIGSLGNLVVRYEIQRSGHRRPVAPGSQDPGDERRQP